MPLAQRSTTNLRIVDGGPRSLDLEGLIAAIVAGSDAAVANFFDATGGLIFGLLLLILGDTATAEDVLSEVHAEVRQQARRFDKNHESILVWLITIAHRRALEKLCSSTEDQQFVISVGLAPQPAAGPSRPFGLSKSAHRKLVRTTLDGLSPLEQRVIELAYFSKMTSRAIATTLQLSPDMVQASLQRGVSRLYSLFKNQKLFGAA